jgi:hypothetical protein
MATPQQQPQGPTGQFTPITWAEGGTATEPSSGRKATGWLAGDVVSQGEANWLSRDPMRAVRAFQSRAVDASAGFFAPWLSRGGVWAELAAFEVYLTLDGGPASHVCDVWLATSNEGAALYQVAVVAADTQTLLPNRTHWVWAPISVLAPPSIARTELAVLDVPIGDPSPSPGPGYVLVWRLDTDGAGLASQAIMLPTVPNMREIGAEKATIPVIATSSIGGIAGDPVTLAGDLDVTGEATIGLTLTVTGDATLLADLIVSGGEITGAALVSATDLACDTLNAGTSVDSPTVTASTFVIAAGGSLVGADALTSIAGLGQIEAAIVRTTSPGRMESNRFELDGAAAGAANTLTRTSGSALVWNASDRVHTSPAGLIFARGFVANAAAATSHTLTTSVAAAAPADGSAVTVRGELSALMTIANTCTLTLQAETAPGSGVYAATGATFTVAVPNAANDWKRIAIERDHAPGGQALRYRLLVSANGGASVAIDSASVTAGPSV